MSARASRQEALRLYGDNIILAEENAVKSRSTFFELPHIELPQVSDFPDLSQAKEILDPILHNGVTYASHEAQDAYRTLFMPLALHDGELGISLLFYIAFGSFAIALISSGGGSPRQG